jgi:formyltetrahydrofolate hydrolase
MHHSYLPAFDGLKQNLVRVERESALGGVAIF